MSLVALVRGCFRSLTRKNLLVSTSARPIQTMTTADRSNLIPFSSRLFEGRALAQDVWSIFKCVHLNVFTLTLSLSPFQRCKSPFRLH